MLGILTVETLNLNKVSSKKSAPFDRVSTLKKLHENDVKV